MNATAGDDFQDLLARARAGDASAMGELAARYEREVRLVARIQLSAALRPYVDSVDLTQSVHMTVMAGLRDEKFDISSPEKLVALAVTVARRKIARHWRRLKRQQRLSRGDESVSGVADRAVDPALAPTDPAQIVSIREQLSRVMSALDERDRQLVQLRLEGRSTAEAARELDLDPDVARVRLSRLRKRLREHGLDEWL